MSVYFIQAVNGGPIKIGKSKDVETRLSQIQYANDMGKLEVLGVVDGYTETERFLHHIFADYRIDPRREWFEPAQPLLDFIANKTIPFKPIKPCKEIVPTAHPQRRQTANRLPALLDRRKWSIYELQKRTKLTYNTVHSIVNARIPGGTTYGTLKKITAALGVKISDLEYDSEPG